MTSIFRAQDRVYADSTHLHAEGDPTRNLLDKVYSLNYIPVYADHEEPKNEHSLPVDYLIGMAYTGSASVGRTVYNYLIKGESIDKIARRYIDARKLNLGVQEGAHVYFVGCKSDYRCIFTARSSVREDVITHIAHREKSGSMHDYNWCGGTAGDDTMDALKEGYHPSAAFIRGIDRQSDTCGGIVEVWRFVPVDDATSAPALFYREGFIDPRPSVLRLSRVSGAEIPLDFTVSAARIEEVATAARNQMAAEQRRTQEILDAVKAEKKKDKRRK